jgi:peptide chain release factor subunit 1
MVVNRIPRIESPTPGMLDRMSTTSLDALRDLAGFRVGNGCAISLYLDLDPQTTVNPGDVQTRVNSLLDLDGRTAGLDSDSLTREQKQGLREDVERIKHYFATDFERSGMRAFALFCCGLDNLWRPLPLPCPVTDDVRLGRELYLAPLLTVLGRGEGALVAVVSRERGEVYRLRGGRLHQIADETEVVPNQHDQGGWSQARFQRHVDDVVAKHLGNVGAQIDRLVRRAPSTQLVVVAGEEIRPDVEAALSSEARNAIVGWASAESHVGGQELLPVDLPVLEGAGGGTAGEALAGGRVVGARPGRAAAGWASTLEAASDGRIELLLVQERAKNREAFECPQCGRGSVADGNCPLDGARLEKRQDGLDLAVHRTLEHGGSVWLARHSEDLVPVEGIGALLRY